MSNSRNTSIPREAISGAAGKNDKFSLEVVDTSTYFKDALNGKHPYNVISNKYKREILSTDLDQGMTIQAVVTKNRRKAEQKINESKNEEGKDI